MSELLAALRATFGGSWDGAGHELHGLLRSPSGDLKVEVVRDAPERWTASVFKAGVCLASSNESSVQDAVAAALSRTG